MNIKLDNLSLTLKMVIKLHNHCLAFMFFLFLLPAFVPSIKHYCTSFQESDNYIL
jgi:hypothetical protein